MYKPFIYEYVEDDVTNIATISIKKKIPYQLTNAVTLNDGSLAFFSCGRFDRFYDRLTDYFLGCLVFDKKTNECREFGKMVYPRFKSCAVLFDQENILIVGGFGLSIVPLINEFPVKQTCEIFNLKTGVSRLSGSVMPTGRISACCSLLPNGKVLICGGNDGVGNILNTTLIYDPSTDSLTEGPFLLNRIQNGSATLLTTGNVLVTEGDVYRGHVRASKYTDIYNFKENRFEHGPPMNKRKLNEFSGILRDGRVLIFSADWTSEYYDPVSNSFSAGPRLIENNNNNDEDED
jgi:hypothetical protein